MSNLTPGSTLEHSGKPQPQAIPDGIQFEGRMVGYSAAIRQLDSGKYDHHLPTGMRLIAEIWDADEKGYFTPTDEQMAIIWRWMVACLFIWEQQDKNGIADIPNEDGGIDRAAIYSGKYGAISIYPATERFSLASHIEGIAIEKYGTTEGLKLAIRMYQDMAETDPDRDVMCLSPMGRDGLTMLHDGFIEMLNTEGMPAAPTAH